MTNIIAKDSAFECGITDQVAIIRLKKNAMRIATDVQTRDKYLGLLNQLEEDSSVSGLIHINDEAFPGETEIRKLIKRMIEDTTFEKVVAYRFRNWISQLVRRRLYFQKPIVAGISGPITMEEFGIYLICDRLVVSDHFSVRNIGLEMGLPPGPLLTFLLPRIIGARKALKLLTDDGAINAPEALELGLVDKVVPQGQFEQECSNQMQRLVHFPSTLVCETRELIFSPFDHFNEHLERSIRQKMQFIQFARRQ